MVCRIILFATHLRQSRHDRPTVQRTPAPAHHGTQIIQIHDPMGHRQFTVWLTDSRVFIWLYRWLDSRQNTLWHLTDCLPHSLRQTATRFPATTQHTQPQMVSRVQRIARFYPHCRHLPCPLQTFLIEI